MKMLNSFLVAVAVLLLATRAAAEEQPFIVTVYVTGSATNEFASYIKRELRALNDVAISTENADYNLYIDVRAIIANSNNRTIGYALSETVTIPQSGSTLDYYVGHCASYVTSAKEAGQDIAIQFDTQFLEPRRQAHIKHQQKVIDTLIPDIFSQFSSNSIPASPATSAPAIH